MSEFPRTEVGGVSLSRMIIGTNWFSGYSHTSRAKDCYIREVMTRKKIADVIEVFLEAGIDTIMGLCSRPELREAFEEVRDRTGRDLIVITTPGYNVDDTPEGYDETARILDESAELGATFCFPHQCSTDALIDRRNRCFLQIDRYCKMTRERGMIPGLSTHMPESIVYADESGLDVESYIQIYNAAGFLMQVEVDWVNRIIHGANKPVMTIKPMAAGRLLPLVGLAFNWATIRPQDMVAVGTMTPDEARECIDISLSVLGNRGSEVELQRTRSKSSVVGES